MEFCDELNELEGRCTAALAQGDDEAFNAARRALAEEARRLSDEGWVVFRSSDKWIKHKTQED